MSADYDLIIVGGGMVGCSLAAALARSGNRILLLAADPGPLPPEEDTELDERVSAVNVGSCNFLRRLGVWQAVSEQRRTPFVGMRVWESGGRGHIGFDAWEIGQPGLGYILENRALHAALWERVLDAGVEVQVHREVVAIEQRGAGAVRVQCADGTAYGATLVVGADGVESSVRRQAGIPAQETDFHHTSVVAHVTTERAHRSLARQVFLPGGPLALLPLPDGRCSVVWSAAPEEAEWLLGLSSAEFREELGRASEYCLGTVLEVGRRRGFPLRGIRAESYVSGSVVLVGDAAHVVHPLAGLGVNLGFGDAASLAELLLRRRGGLSGSEDSALLRRYERWRRGENDAVISVIRGLNWLFAQEGAAWGNLRGFGMSLFQGLAPGKRWLMRQAAGLGSGQPEAMRRPVFNGEPGGCGRG